METCSKVINYCKVLDNLEKLRFKQRSGANSVVHKVIFEGNTVALKKINCPNPRKGEQFKDFFRECIVTIIAEHPAVLHLTGWNFFCISEHTRRLIYQPCTATEFCDGEMLSNSLNKLFRDRDYYDDIFIQTQMYLYAYGIAIGMSYLHSLNILHRDLKNDNIYVIKPKWDGEDIPEEIKPLFEQDDEYMIPVVADLGYSKVIQNIEQSMQCGSLSFMSPECMDSSFYDFPSDVYSYSIILCTIFQLQNTPKYKDEYLNPTAFINYVISAHGRPDVSECNDAQIKYLQKLWSHNPSERPSFKEIVKYLENPPKEDFIFDDYDPSVIQAFKKYIEMKIRKKEEANTEEEEDDEKNEGKEAQIILDIMNKYKEIDITNEEYYQFKEEDARTLNSKHDIESFSSILISTIDDDDEEETNSTRKTKGVKISKYVSEYIKNFIRIQDSKKEKEISEFYLSEGIKSEGRQEYNIAKEFYIKSIKLGNLQGVTRLGILLLKSSEKETRQKGIDLLKYSSKMKDTEGLFYYGYLISEGDEEGNIKADKKLGAQLLVESGQQGHPRAFYEAATIYHELGLEAKANGDKEKARALLTTAMKNYKASYKVCADKESKRLSEELQNYLKDN